MRSLIHRPDTGLPPDRLRSGLPGRLRRLGAAILTGAILAAGLSLGAAAPAEAGVRGVGYDEGLGFLGAFVSESDGRQAYCIDADAPPVWNSATSGPQTVTSLISNTGAQMSDATLAKLNYILSKWGQSGDRQVTAAVSMAVWQYADPVTYNSHGMSGDSYYIGRVPGGERAAVLGNLATMRAEAEANSAAHPQVSLGIRMVDHFDGTLTVQVDPVSMSGQVVLTNAIFADGTTSKAATSGEYRISGVPPLGAPEYQVSASASYSGTGLGARVNLYTTPGAQRLLANGTPTAVTDSVSTPVIPLDFQPIIGTQVASRFVDEGGAFIDQLTVDTVGQGAWIRVAPPVATRAVEAPGDPVALTATGTLYGPFEEQPTESETPPEDAPIVGTESVVLDRGPGEYESAGTLTATGAGFYTWVWEIEKDAQGENARYIRDSFRDWFGRVAETHVGPFQPTAVSRSDARLAVPGDEVADTVTVSSVNGPWLRIDGEPIPVILDGTAYQVTGTLPPTEQEGVPEDAVAIGSVQVTATGPGSYTSPPVAFPDAGFVTWVWEVRLSSQPAELVDYLAEDWADFYGIPVESTSVRHPAKITSELREYNVHQGGRAFDEVTLAGFPDDHGTFTGDGYWGADLDEVTHTVYGPFETDTVLTEDLDLAEAPVLTSVTTPARNGTYRIGYTDADEIRPTEPGYYVVVSSFAGDDRVQPYTSSPADILERFYVPTPPSPPEGVDVQVSTRATAAAFVGDEFSDGATVTGDVPEGAYLVFRAYGPYAEQPTADEELEPFFTSDQISVAGEGDYESGATSLDEPGMVFWIETLYDVDGQVLAEGFLGAENETTIVHPRETELTVSTRAVSEVELGEPAHDVAIVEGTIPDDTSLVFQAFRQDDPDLAVCDAESLVFDTTEVPVAVTEAGEYASAEVVFEEVGTYFWIESLFDQNGDLLHRGVCGTEGETTVVVAAPAVPETPDEPATPAAPGLAFTGASGPFGPIGIGALGLLALGATVLIGRGLRRSTTEPEQEQAAERA
ncbi:MAG: hypothetical protein J0H23_11645 [Micrococcales bacterium]|nr:hypothetical protein [Micrococcales bacterium]OJX69389.1 MAG: hypothetical protein BGO94_12775 [Micrococcales bacterium 72-143]